MVQDAPGLRHAGSRDNDHRLLATVQSLGFIDRPNVGEALELKGGMPALLDEGTGLLVKALRMTAEDVRGVDSQWAVHVDRHLADIALEDQLIEVKHQFLRAPHG